MAPKKNNRNFVNDVLDYATDRRLNGGISVAELSSDGVTWKPLAKHVADKTADRHRGLAKTGLISERQLKQCAEEAYDEMYAATKIGAAIDMVSGRGLFNPEVYMPSSSVYIPSTTYVAPMYTTPFITTTNPVFVVSSNNNHCNNSCNPPQQQYNPPPQQQYNPPQATDDEDDEILSRLSKMLKKSEELNKIISS